MSQSNQGNSKGFLSPAALTEGVCVKLSAAGTVVVATAATDKIIGVTNGPNDAGTTASIKLRSGTGTYKLKLGATAAVGDYLTSNGVGQLIPTTTAGNAIVGQALEAGSTGDFIEALVVNDRV